MDKIAKARMANLRSQGLRKGETESVATERVSTESVATLRQCGKIDGRGSLSGAIRRPFWGPSAKIGADPAGVV